MPLCNDVAGLRRQHNCRRWDPDKDRKDQAERMLQLRDIIGNTNTGQKGVGISHFQQWSKASAAERHTMVEAEVRRAEEGQRKARSTELEIRGPGKIGIYQSDN